MKDSQRLKNLHEAVESMYLDYFNNFLSVGFFAKRYELNINEAKAILALGKRINRKKGKEMINKISTSRLDDVISDVETKVNESNGPEDKIDLENLLLIKSFFEPSNVELLKQLIDNAIDEMDMDNLDEINTLTKLMEMM